MPWYNKTSLLFNVNKIIPAGLILTLLFTGIIFFISRKQWNEMNYSSERVDHTEKVLLHIRKLMLTAVDNETGARGYVITGKQVFLEPLLESEKIFSEELKTMGQMVADNPGQLRLLDSVRAYVAKRISFSHQMVNSRDSAGFAGAELLVNSGVGKSYTDRIRTLGSQMEEGENRLLMQRKANHLNVLDNLNKLLYTMLGITLLLGVWMVISIRREFIARRTAHQMAENINTELEHRVAARTSEVYESEKRLRYTLDNMIEGAQIISNDWVYLYINEAAAKQGKSTKEALMGRKMTEIYPGIENTTLFHEMELCMREKIRFQMENNFKFPDGSDGWFDLRIQPVPEGIFILSVDITERKKANAQIQLLSAIVNSSELAIISKTLEGEITSWNNGAAAVFGYTAAEMIGRNIRTLIPPELQNEEDVIVNLLKQRQQVLPFETVRLHKNGHVIDVALAVSPVLDEKGNVIGASKIARDISERKQIEKERQERRAEEQRLVTAAIIHAQEEERNAIGKELHDNVNQILVGANLLLSAVTRDITKASSLVPICMDHLQEAINENRKISHSFIAPDLDTEDLPDQLEKLRFSMLEPAGIKVELDTSSYYKTCINNEMKLNLYRIAQEQFTNITRYAAATTADVELKCDVANVQLCISDNGKGADLSKQPKGVGLRNIESRAGIFKGTVSIITSPGKGFTVKVNLPIQEQQ